MGDGVGMSGPLKNQRHERFCQALLKGKGADEAYQLAGFAPDRGHASRLAANGSVVARMAELKGKVADRAEITQAKVLEELAKIGFANMSDYTRIGDDGDPYMDFSNLTREQAAAIVEMTVEDFKDGRGENARDVRRIKFRLADKQTALVNIGKHLGMFKDKVEHSGRIEFEDFSAPISRDTIARFLREKGNGETMQ